MTVPHLNRATLRSCNAATAGPDGAAEVRLSASGFDASLIAELVNHGLVTLAAEKVESRRRADRGRQGADN